MNIWNLNNFLKAKFLRICPYGEQYLNKLVTICKKDMFLLGTLSVSVLIIWNSFFAASFLYRVEGIILVCCLVGAEVPNYHVQKKESRMYQELLLYFARVKHCYMAGHHMANAVMDAAEDMGHEIRRLANEIYSVLMESNRKERIREYILYRKTNRFLKLFLIQAYEVSEKGDAFFAENIEHLRLELMEEMYRRKQRSHEFAGYVFVSVAPFFMMPVLKQWGLDFAPELAYFYAGTGLLLETVTFFATILIYGMISGAKEITLFDTRQKENFITGGGIYKNTWIASVIRRLEQANGNFSRKVRGLLVQSGERTSFGKLCFQMLVTGSSVFILLVCFCIGMHQQERASILNRVESIETIAPVAGEEKRAQLKECILTLTRLCKDDTDITDEEIKSLLRERVRLGNATTEQAVVQEIRNKLQQYRSAKCSLGEILVCLLIGIMTGWLPLLLLCFRVRIIRAEAVNEVKQFQAIILMERKMQGITIIELLEDMEVFSKCFQSCLKKCINSYSTNPRTALLRLKEEGSKLHEGFEELADAFLSVDEVGIELAFAEVESNRKLLEKMTQLETEINLEKKKDITELLAKIPLVLAVGAYFIIPFFGYSLEGVYEVFELLEEMQ